MTNYSIDYFDLSTLVKTKQDGVDVTTTLTELISSLYNLKQKADEVLNKHFSYEEKKSLVAILQKNKIDTTNPSALKEFFIYLKEYIEALPVATIYVAFEPHKETVETLSEWFFVSLKKEVLLDIHIDKSLIGGAILSFKGLYRDYSLRKTIQEQFGSATPLQNPK